MHCFLSTAPFIKGGQGDFLFFSFEFGNPDSILIKTIWFTNGKGLP